MAPQDPVIGRKLRLLSLQYAECHTHHRMLGRRGQGPRSRPQAWRIRVAFSQLSSPRDCKLNHQKSGPSVGTHLSPQGSLTAPPPPQLLGVGSVGADTAGGSSSGRPLTPLGSQTPSWLLATWMPSLPCPHTCSALLSCPACGVSALPLSGHWLQSTWSLPCLPHLPLMTLELSCLGREGNQDQKSDFFYSSGNGAQGLAHARQALHY